MTSTARAEVPLRNHQRADARRRLDRTGPMHNEETGGPYAALELELGVFWRRARAASDRLSRAVHPDLDSAAHGLLIRLRDHGPVRRRGERAPPALGD